MLHKACDGIVGIFSDSNCSTVKKDLEKSLDLVEKDWDRFWDDPIDYIAEEPIIKDIKNTVTKLVTDPGGYFDEKSEEVKQLFSDLEVFLNDLKENPIETLVGFGKDYFVSKGNDIKAFIFGVDPETGEELSILSRLLSLVSPHPAIEKAWDTVIEPACGKKNGKKNGNNNNNNEEVCSTGGNKSDESSDGSSNESGDDDSNESSGSNSGDNNTSQSTNSGKVTTKFKTEKPKYDVPDQNFKIKNGKDKQDRNVKYAVLPDGQEVKLLGSQHAGGNNDKGIPFDKDGFVDFSKYVKAEIYLKPDQIKGASPTQTSQATQILRDHFKENSKLKQEFMNQFPKDERELIEEHLKKGTIKLETIHGTIIKKLAECN
ncbi:hypothetical protein [Risungbinella massiliensis]|uniref:hypothetical protein n=1 Tax=Risungbinella massiliensis TaxID=1329796 RepID=UPI0005CC727A|nr:hypothetical protein [Risungbinella massiliensis]